jgi:hypothetical protein
MLVLRKEQNMDNITVDFELAKKLKKAGYKQESVFHWLRYKQIKLSKLVWAMDDGDIFLSDSQYSAPTTDELLEMLPHFFHQYELTIVKSKNKYTVSYFDLGDCEHYLNMIFVEEKLCNALAKMYLYLKKEGLI